mgnify:CR=1 FL=1
MSRNSALTARARRYLADAVHAFGIAIKYRGLKDVAYPENSPYDFVDSLLYGRIRVREGDKYGFLDSLGKRGLAVAPEFVAEGGEVRMRSIRLHYLNGHVEDIQFEQNLNPGQEIDVDLHGKDGPVDREAVMARIRSQLSSLPAQVAIGQPISHRIDHMLSGTRASIAAKRP